MNMTYYYPNLKEENFNNGDAIMLNRFEFNKNFIYGKFPKANDKDIFYINSKKNDSLNGEFIVHDINANKIITFRDSIQFDNYAKANKLKTSEKLKSFDEKYSEIVQKNRWKKILFLQY